MAAQSKYTPERIERIVDALRDGSSRRDAYQSAGIDERTFQAWLKRYSAFSAQVTEAEAICAVNMSAIITNTAREGDAKYALEWLKRRRREEWGDSIAADLTTGGQPITVKEIIIQREAAPDPED